MSACPALALQLTQLEALDLAGGGLGQLGHELDKARVLVGRQTLFDEGLELVFRGAGEVWGVDYLHQQAFEVLPALLAVLGVDAAAPPWLYGHSDGGSIALLHAARNPASVAGLIVAAPHIMVEDISVANIEKARMAYVDGDLRSRLAKHHDDPDSAFWGWNRIWLDPAFREWSITAELPGITCPLLAVQGLEDEYGTLAQIRGIAQVLPHTVLLELPACGHTSHRDQRELLINAAAAFIHRHHPPPPC